MNYFLIKSSLRLSQLQVEKQARKWPLIRLSSRKALQRFTQKAQCSSVWFSSVRFKLDGRLLNVRDLFSSLAPCLHFKTLDQSLWPLFGAPLPHIRLTRRPLLEEFESGSSFAASFTIFRFFAVSSRDSRHSVSW